jgi:hypothetical protein
MINEYFIILYLVFFWWTCILYKDNMLPNLICEFGERLQQSKKKIINKIGILLQELSSCFFCMDNWICLFFVAIPVSIYNQNFHYLLIGVLFSSISAHFRK